LSCRPPSGTQASSKRASKHCQREAVVKLAERAVSRLTSSAAARGDAAAMNTAHTSTPLLPPTVPCSLPHEIRHHRHVVVGGEVVSHGHIDPHGARRSPTTPTSSCCGGSGWRAGHHVVQPPPFVASPQTRPRAPVRELLRGGVRRPPHVREPSRCQRRKPVPLTVAESRRLVAVGLGSVDVLCPTTWGRGGRCATGACVRACH